MLKYIMLENGEGRQRGREKERERQEAYLTSVVSVTLGSAFNKSEVKKKTCDEWLPQRQGRGSLFLVGMQKSPYRVIHF